MPSSKDDPVGQLFYLYDQNGHDAEVITIGVEFDLVNRQLKSVTFLVVDVTDDDEPAIRLQRFSADKDPVTIPLTLDEMNLMIHENGILFKRRATRRRERGR